MRRNATHLYSPIRLLRPPAAWQGRLALPLITTHGGRTDARAEVPGISNTLPRAHCVGMRSRPPAKPEQAAQQRQAQQAHF